MSEPDMTITASHAPPYVKGEPQSVTFVAADGRESVVTVDLLTRRSSHRDTHVHPTQFATAGQKCRACRWIEVVLARTLEGDYVAQTIGMSLVPGETNNFFIVRSADPYALLDDLVVHKASTGARFLPVQTADAFDDFGDLDPVIGEAFDDWRERNSYLLSS